MHVNPVARGLVRHAKDWPWSSYAFYAQSGAILLSIDPDELRIRCAGQKPHP